MCSATRRSARVTEMKTMCLEMLNPAQRSVTVKPEINEMGWEGTRESGASAGDGVIPWIHRAARIPKPIQSRSRSTQIQVQPRPRSNTQPRPRSNPNPDPTQTQIQTQTHQHRTRTRTADPDPDPGPDAESSRSRRSVIPIHSHTPRPSYARPKRRGDAATRRATRIYQAQVRVAKAERDSTRRLLSRMRIQ